MFTADSNVGAVGSRSSDGSAARRLVYVDASPLRVRERADFQCRLGLAASPERGEGKVVARRQRQSAATDHQAAARANNDAEVPWSCARPVAHGNAPFPSLVHLAGGRHADGAVRLRAGETE
eukprot:SAG31_NODE_11733_length_1002_cov_1.312292_1_plen_121_part_01